MLASALIVAAFLTPSSDVKDSVKRGLKWLASQQSTTGSWTGNNDIFRVQITAQAGLAFLMEGSTPKEGAYAENIRLAMGWFEAAAQSNGVLVPATEMSENGRLMQAHGTALLFLASAYDVDDDQPRRKRFAKLLAAAVDYAVAGQTRRGGWGYLPGRDGSDYDETLLTASMVHALLTAQRAGIDVPRAALDRATKYFLNATNRDGAVVFSLVNGLPRGGDGQPNSTAGVAAVAMLVERPPQPLAGWVAYAKRAAPAFPVTNVPRFPLNSFALQQHLATARIANSFGEDGHRKLDPNAPDINLLRWSAYREPLFRYLRASQTPTGSWDDQAIGPAYTTAIVLCILQLENNYLPAFSR